MGIKNFLKEVINQTSVTIDETVKSILPATKEVWISPKCMTEAQKLGLTQEDILDVYHHGQPYTTSTGSTAMRKTYGDYQLGVSYRLGSKTGSYLITWCWKNPRR